MSKMSKKPLAIAIGTVIAGSLGAANIANANENPFGMSDLSSGYMQVAEKDAKDGKEATCGEGKCGGMKMDKAKAEGKCAGMNDEAKKEEAKSEEGKCGGMMGEAKSKEGKCGAMKDKDADDKADPAKH